MVSVYLVKFKPRILVTWEYVIPCLFGAAILAQLFYLLFVFSFLIRHRDKQAEQVPLLSVSIVVAAWNELANLKELLPLLDAQNYPDFEIIVVDDRSSDGSYDYLRTNEGQFKNVTYVNVKALPDHFTAKKYAVTMGIKKAQKELILLTDADCRPQSDQWIRQMSAQLTEDCSVVLGFSPYDKYPGFLNAFIRYETFQTALQYFSFSKFGIPFMGVGRNLMYRRDSFWSINGFASHMELLSGDDDLFINEISNKNNTTICISEEAQVFSEPKQSFKEWVIQKRRHLSVGKRYRLHSKVSLGLLWMSFLLCWILFIPVLFSSPSWFNMPEWLKVSNEYLAQFGIKHYEPFSNWMRVVSFVFIFWLLLRWLILHLANKRLSRTVSSFKLLFFDFLYFIYLIVFGLMSLLSNPKKIKWR